jgi:hypothetical protein
MPHRSIAFLLFATSALVQTATATCYFRNGTEQTTPGYAPCSNNSTNPLSNVCCASWDTCLPNGLCQNTNNKNIYRESCAKSNWDEGGCQDLCSNEVGIWQGSKYGVGSKTDEEQREAQRNTDILVTPCGGDADSTTWCCGETNACCTEGSGFAQYTIAARFGDPVPTDLSSSSISSSSTLSSVFSASSTSASVLSSASTSTARPATSSTAAATVRNGLSTGAKAGIGIGAALGAIALIGLGVFMYKAMQWRKKARGAAPPYTYSEEYAPKDVYAYVHDRNSKVAQLAGIESAVHEMPASKTISEMHAATPDKTSGNDISRL